MPCAHISSLLHRTFQLKLEHLKSRKKEFSARICLSVLSVNLAIAGLSVCLVFPSARVKSLGPHRYHRRTFHSLTFPFKNTKTRRKTISHLLVFPFWKLIPWNICALLPNSFKRFFIFFFYFVFESYMLRKIDQLLFDRFPSLFLFLLHLLYGTFSASVKYRVKVLKGKPKYVLRIYGCLVRVFWQLTFLGS